MREPARAMRAMELAQALELARTQVLELARTQALALARTQALEPALALDHWIGRSNISSRT